MFYGLHCGEPFHASVAAKHLEKTAHGVYATPSTYQALQATVDGRWSTLVSKPLSCLRVHQPFSTISAWFSCLSSIFDGFHKEDSQSGEKSAFPAADHLPRSSHWSSLRLHSWEYNVEFWRLRPASLGRKGVFLSAYYISVWKLSIGVPPSLAPGARVTFVTFSFACASTTETSENQKKRRSPVGPAFRGRFLGGFRPGNDWILWVFTEEIESFESAVEDLRDVCGWREMD